MQGQANRRHFFVRLCTAASSLYSGLLLSTGESGSGCDDAMLEVTVNAKAPISMPTVFKNDLFHLQYGR
jgi:hypothetical protein